MQARENVVEIGIRRNRQRFARIKRLRCFQQVHRRIGEGCSLASIANYIQQEQRESRDVKQASLEIALGEYRRSLPPSDPVTVAMPVSFDNASHLYKSLDELDVLDKLYMLQKARIELFCRTEIQFPKLRPLKNLSDDLALLAKLLAILIRIRHKAKRGSLPERIRLASAWAKERREREAKAAFQDPEIRRLVETLIGTCKAKENACEKVEAKYSPFVQQRDIDKLKASSHFRQIERRIKSGLYSLYEIGRIIQEEYLENSDMKPGYLESVLRCYRASLPPKAVSPQACPPVGKKLAPGLAELVEAAKLQTARVEGLVAGEKTRPIPVPSREMTREIASLAETLKTSLQLKEDLGVAGKSEVEQSPEAGVVIAFKERFGRQAAETFRNPDSRRKILSVVDSMIRFLKLKRENGRKGSC